MSGYKEWGIGEVVEAGDFQTYIQNQAVMKFADSASRTTALGTAVAEGMVSYLADTNAIEYYSGSAWVGVASDGDITGVTAGTALTGGGTSGAVTLDVDLSAITIPASQLSDVTSTATELNYVDGVTSAIQTQLNGKVDETNGAVTTASVASTVVRNITLSTSAPSGGSDGDVWLVYTP